MTTFTDDAIALVHDRLNNGLQVLAGARVDSFRRGYLIEDAYRILGECAKALEAGQLVPDGPHAEPWAKDDYETDAEWAARMQHVPTIDETARRIMANDARRDMEDDGK